MSIYTPAGLQPERVRPRAGNRCWAKVRPEMLAMRGWFTPPYSVTADSGCDMDAMDGKAADLAEARRLVCKWLREVYAARPDADYRNLNSVMRRMESVYGGDLELRRYEERYRGVDPSRWEPEDLDDWLFRSLFLVYEASLCRPTLLGDFDLDSLAGDGYLPRIPPNPLDGWRPVRLLGRGDQSSPGDLCLMWAGSYWIGPGPDELIPATYQMFIYGNGTYPDRTESMEQHLMLRDGTFSIPEGTCHTTGCFYGAYLLNADYKKALCMG